MHRIWKLPETQESTQERPARCLRCGSRRMYRHSRQRRRVIDPQLETVEVIRYRCEDCRKMGREHQLCVAHARKALSRRLRKIPGYEAEKEVVRGALRELTPQARRDLRRLPGVFADARPPTKGHRWSGAYAMRMCILSCFAAKRVRRFAE